MTEIAKDFTLEEMQSIVKNTDMKDLVEKLKLADGSWAKNLHASIQADGAIDDIYKKKLSTSAIYNVQYGQITNPVVCFIFITKALALIKNAESALNKIVTSSSVTSKDFSEVATQ